MLCLFLKKVIHQIWSVKATSRHHKGERSKTNPRLIFLVSKKIQLKSILTNGRESNNKLNMAKESVSGVGGVTANLTPVYSYYLSETSIQL